MQAGLPAWRADTGVEETVEQMESIQLSALW